MTFSCRLDTLPCDSTESSSVRTLITLLIESGEETPLESLSTSSVSGLYNSRDSNFGKGLARFSCLLDVPAVEQDLLTIGKHCCFG